jgi:hypothetical protein
VRSYVYIFSDDGLREKLAAKLFLYFKTDEELQKKEIQVGNGIQKTKYFI